ncbi:MAG: type I restriction endonuclease subunit R, partial [Gammaproteobacteria bacterium]|nr:type I restriction endonuclease subunit R [Gammaproteobacteria bacterium]
MTTDTSERGLERIICAALTGIPCDPARDNTLTEIPSAQKQVSFGGVGKEASPYGGVGWICGSPNDYDREYCTDLEQLSAFLRTTQPETAGSLSLDEDGPTRRKFLARLEREIANRGIIDVLRKGIKHGAHHLDLFYGTPSPGNEQASVRYGMNHFSVTRQLRYSQANTQNSLDLGLF